MSTSGQSTHHTTLHFYVGSIVAHQIQIHLRPVPQLCKSTYDVIKLFESNKFAARPRFTKVDIKDVYLLGSHECMAKDVPAICPHGSSMCDAVGCMISHQYLRVQAFPNRLYHVHQGSGMGQCWSGEVSYLTFYNRVE